MAAFSEGPIDFYKSQVQVQIIRSKANPDYKGAHVNILNPKRVLEYKGAHVKIINPKPRLQGCACKHPKP